MTGVFNTYKTLSMADAKNTIHGVAGIIHDGFDWYHTTDSELAEQYARLLENEPGVEFIDVSARGEEPKLRLSLHLTHLPLLPGFRQDSTNVEAPKPKFVSQDWWDELFSYQRSAINHITRNSGTILCDDLGLGKTRTCIGGAKPPVVVLCKKSDALVWKMELEYANIPYKALASRCVDPKAFEDKNVLFWIVPYSVAAFWLPYFTDIGMGPTINTVIVDETHEVQNKKTNAAKAIRTLNYERGIFVSATVQRNRLQSLWGILDAACTGRPFGAHWQFRTAYCAAEDNGYGLQDGKPTEASLERLSKRIDPLVLKRTKAAVGQVLPPMERRLVKLSISPQDRRELIARVGGSVNSGAFKAEGAKGGNHLVAINAFRRAVGSQKAVLAADMIAEQIIEWGRGVVWIHHKDVGDLMKTRLKRAGIVVEQIHGGTNVKTREKIGRDWKLGPLMPDKPKALVASISAANTALSFTTCGYQAFLEYDWSNVQMMQAEARLNRTGQQHPIILTEYYIIPGTIDEHLGKIIVEKAQEAEALLGVDGQGDQARTIVGAEQESEEAFMQRLAARLKEK